MGIHWKWFKSKSGIDDSKSQVDVSNISEDLTNDEYIFQEIVLRLLSPPDSSLNIKSLKTNLIRRLNKFIEENIYTLILDDLIFSKEEQASLFHDINEELKRLDTLLSYPWMQGKLRIAFAGKFSSGKSSIINSLLSENLVPTDVTPTTALPTQITFIPNFDTNKVYLINRDGEFTYIDKKFLEVIKHDSFNNFYGKLIQELIDSVIVNHTNELLKKAIFVDTPGYNPSSSNIDRDLALKAIKGSDIVFWVMDIEDGDISRDSLELINQELEGKKFYVIINKVDRKPPSQRNKVKEKVEKTLKNSQISYEKVLMFSSKEGEKYIKDLKFLLEQLSDIYRPKAVNIPVLELLNSIINTTIAQLSIFSKKPDKENIEKYIKRKLYPNINHLITQCIEDYAEYDEPLIFGNACYKINVEDIEDFMEELSSSVLEYFTEFILSKGFKSNEEIKKYINEDWKKAEKMLKLARKVLLDFENLKNEIERSILKSLKGGEVS